MQRQHDAEPIIDAYIETSYDDHLNENVHAHDRRIQYLTGFTGNLATLLVTNAESVLFTTSRYIAQADSETDCDWTLFVTNETVNLSDWISVCR